MDAVSVLELAKDLQSNCVKTRGFAWKEWSSLDREQREFWLRMARHTFRIVAEKSAMERKVVRLR